MRHVYVSLDKKVNVVNHIKYKVKLRANICLDCLRNTIPDCATWKTGRSRTLAGSSLHGKRFRASLSRKLGREQKKNNNTLATQAS